MKRISRAFATGAALLSVLAACGRAGSGHDPDGISHPSGSNRLVLRIETTGGFVSPNFLATRFPEFSLFGDGSVITEGPVPAIYPGPALPNLLERRLTKRGVQAVLRAAAKAGLLGPNRSYLKMTVSDLPTTVFTLVGRGRKHVISVYGLGESVRSSRPAGERGARKALAGLEQELLDLTKWLPKGSYSAERPFRPSALRVFVRPDLAAASPSLSEPRERWPLAAPLATFGRPSSEVPGSRCGTVRGDDAISVLRLAKKANQLTPWTSGGRAFVLVFRPLLPDESGC